MAGYERAAALKRTKLYQSSQKGEGEIPTTGQGIYDESSTQKYEVGQRLCLNDGRVFYYCKNGAVALAVGKPLQSPVNRTMVANITNAVAGDDYVVIDSAAATIADGDYDNGYLIMQESGHMYKIRHSPAIASAAAGNIYLYDAVGFATTSDDCTIYKNPCHSVIVQADAVAFTIGVPLIAVTASYYFWAQTWGPCAVLTRIGGADLGNRLLLPDLTGVSLEQTGSGVTGAQRVAFNMYDSTGMTGTEYELVFLICMA